MAVMIVEYVGCADAYCQQSFFPHLFKHHGPWRLTAQGILSTSSSYKHLTLVCEYSSIPFGTMESHFIVLRDDC